MFGFRRRQVVDSIRLREGLELRVAGRPDQSIRTTLETGRVGWQAEDLPGIRPRFLVEVGDQVRIGDPVLVDRARTGIVFSAPAAGRIVALETGPRRMFQRMEIDVGQDEWREFSTATPTLSGPALRELMLQSGLWTALLERPFGRIPDTAAVADAVFVQAIDTQPLAADAAVIIGQSRAEFAAGVAALESLCDGPLFVCQGPGEAVMEASTKARVVRFHGRHPAGLPGTHIHHLFPIVSGRRVWQIHHQDVIALGQLLLQGRLPAQRVVSIAGDAAREPALYRVRPGADLNAVWRQQGIDTHSEPHALAISGSLLHGRPAAYLGRRHHQITLMRRRLEAARPGGWRWLPLAPVSPLLPLERLERVFPLRLLPAPLLRSLAVGDAEMAIRLGALQLLEEDLDLLSHVCASGSNHANMLRRLLDDWLAEGLETESPPIAEGTSAHG